MVKVKESEIFQINHWKYKVVSNGKEKELHALYKDAHDYDGLEDTNTEWIVVSDISEMRVWLFNKLMEKLEEIGHELSLVSVFYETIVFKN